MDTGGEEKKKLYTGIATETYSRQPQGTEPKKGRGRQLPFKLGT